MRLTRNMAVSEVCSSNKKCNSKNHGRQNTASKSWPTVVAGHLKRLTHYDHSATRLNVLLSFDIRTLRTTRNTHPYVCETPKQEIGYTTFKSCTISIKRKMCTGHTSFQGLVLRDKTWSTSGLSVGFIQDSKTHKTDFHQKSET